MVRPEICPVIFHSGRRIYCTSWLVMADMKLLRLINVKNESHVRALVAQLGQSLWEMPFPAR